MMRARRLLPPVSLMIAISIKFTRPAVRYWRRLIRGFLILLFIIMPLLICQLMLLEPPRAGRGYHYLYFSNTVRGTTPRGQ